MAPIDPEIYEQLKDLLRSTEKVRVRFLLRSSNIVEGILMGMRRENCLGLAMYSKSKSSVVLADIPIDLVDGLEVLPKVNSTSFQP